jgi:hypothetical protein
MREPLRIHLVSALCVEPFGDLETDIVRTATILSQAGYPKKRAWWVAISKYQHELRAVMPEAFAKNNTVFASTGCGLRLRTVVDNPAADLAIEE